MAVWMKRRGKLHIWWIMFLALVLVGACGQSEEQNVDVEQEQPSEALDESFTEVPGPGADAPPTDSLFPILVTDDAGNEVVIPQDPQRIVTLIPSITETVFALGLGDRVVGVSDYCNYPAETENITKVGAADINAEVLLSLEPDLALVTMDHHVRVPELLDEFRAAGIPVVVVDYSAETFDDVFRKISFIGEATATVYIAQDLIRDMQDHLQQLQDLAAAIDEPKKVYVEVHQDPLFTTGANTFMHEMLLAINAENAAAHVEGWVQFSEEEVVALDPDVILTTYGFYIDDPVGLILSREGWSEIPAVVNGEIHDVDSDMVTRSGPRVIDGLEEVARAIYPEVFAR